MTETLDLARTNIASGVKTDDLKPIKDLLIRQHKFIQNTLGALQKLSLRRSPQNAMIAADVIEWLVGALADIDQLCLYSIEYGAALLMNLSLRTAGKAKCADPSLDILPVLSQLMESDSLQVRTYVNGTLYSILVRSSLKEHAAEIGLPDSLPALFRLQVDLFAESPLDLSAADGAAGEELLCSHYIAGFADAQREAARLDDNDPHQAEAARRAAAAQAATARGMPVRRYHSSDEPLQRPATPGSVKTRAELQPLQPALTKSERDRVRAKAPSEAAPL
ncbi:hypothetical protein EMIHUDRAFT_206876 [Emiliania huxleyi CCMP1516]|uniref:LisH domain-containing protein n=2 Tax=Emiliania huxleyi TaxID=2903 RepID=A0A0D3JK67_EMIH1|nr:hypothetical protein EMIHUDRAFT_206876 [Emiliania huxleyi CCMP1516]EOD23902.1 hypothetical protein EMIHUDRAFT_206876 [Emiliania huxleyi CCMP1516]|eukprot:XP_005776331.1 hypothetical protein EMIHUDRAFT_206876 [Emiliania huxleyi CCMP1516]